MTAPDFGALVVAVPHHERCNVWAGNKLDALPAIQVTGGLITFEPACTCDRDARIGRGIAAAVATLNNHVGCECGIYTAAVRAFAEASK